MSQLSRRDLLRASAAAAVVVPFAKLSGSASAAATSAALTDRASSNANDAELSPHEAAGVNAQGPVIAYVKDAASGDVSILHGTSETVVRDRRLVSKIVRARQGVPKA